MTGKKWSVLSARGFTETVNIKNIRLEQEAEIV